MMREMRWSSAEPRRQPATARSRSRKENISYSREEDALPPHLRSLKQLLQRNAASLRKFSTNFLHLTNSEMHPASTQLQALVRSQESSLSDLLSCVTQEVKHGKERINDLMTEMLKKDSSVVHQRFSMQTIYTTLTCVTNICNAAEGLVFLQPTPSNTAYTIDPCRATDWREEELNPAKQREELPEATHKKSAPLFLVAHVAGHKFNPLADGSTVPIVYDLCCAVGRSNCAANVVAKSGGPPREFDSALVCPILRPGHTSTIMGVVCLLNKISTYEGKFSLEDESRAVFAAEQIAEHLVQLPLRIGEDAELPLTPSGFQDMWERVCGETKVGSTGVGVSVRETIPRKFIFRFTHDGANLSTLKFRNRLAVDPSEVLVDVLGRSRMLELENDQAQNQIRSLKKEAEVLRSKLHNAQLEKEKVEKEAADLRIASERSLRMAFLRSRTAASCSPPPFQIPLGTTTDSLLQLPEQQQRCDSAALEEAIDISKLPAKFLAQAESLRSRSFFPRPPPPWNSKAKPVMPTPFLVKRSPS